MPTGAAFGVARKARTVSKVRTAISPWFFIFFFCSGLCSLLYEVIWLRLGMAAFGVTTPLISIFLSIFLAGLGIGSWVAGKLSRVLDRRSSGFFIRAYAATELLIGCSAVLVPWELHRARALFDQSMSGIGLGNGAYYALSGTALVAILLPWCTFMGATFPLAMAAIRKWNSAGAVNSFSYLYLANVLGAVLGALLPAFVLVELFGFRQTLLIGATLNLFIFALGLIVSWFGVPVVPDVDTTVRDSHPSAAPATVSRRAALWVLFLTGIVSLGMEVVWIRQFTPYLGATIWAFAMILAVYLAATFAGSRAYRWWARGSRNAGNSIVWSLVGVAGLLPCLTADPRARLYQLVHLAALVAPFPGFVRFVADFIKLLPVLRVVVGIAPFTALVGFLTPMLVDQFSGGDPEPAGKAYAVNVCGCIAGPLLASFVLLPLVGERWTLVVLSVPLLALASIFPAFTSHRRQAILYLTLSLVALPLIILPQSYEDTFQHKVLHRDYTATTVATGEGMDKQLFVNGIGLTSLTPNTKVMAHFPLALLERRPKDALDICLGMGTTYRSLSTWGIKVTAVELLPSVVESFPYYHPSDPTINIPGAQVIVDDGRLFLERSTERYDVITIDPPPPLNAPASSLLYSKDFYALIKRHLRPGGILQQWMPFTNSSDMRSEVAIVRAAVESFAHVRVFGPLQADGIHIIASDSPIVVPSPQELSARLPATASADFVTWGPGASAAAQFELLLGKERDVNTILSQDPSVATLDDDHPVNEYCLLHRIHSYRPTRTPVSNFFDIFGH